MVRACAAVRCICSLDKITMEDNGKIIEFHNVSFSYESEDEQLDTYAVSGLDVSFEKGSFVAVLGHNGSGKSTLAKLCNAILVPDEGDVIVNGINTRSEENKFDIRETVGMVFQNPDNQIVATIVEEDVAFGPENLGLEPSEIRVRVDEALEAVGMYEYRLSEPHRLSGGQKQRVAIAGVIAMKPQCIVLDESTAMLDPRGRKEVMNTVRELNESLGITVIYITHYMEEAVYAGRVIVMDKGKIVSDGTPSQVFSQVDKIKSIGLDVPQATEFAAYLRSEGLDIKGDVLDADSCIEAVLKAKGMRA